MKCNPITKKIQLSSTSKRKKKTIDNQFMNKGYRLYSDLLIDISKFYDSNKVIFCAASIELEVNEH